MKADLGLWIEALRSELEATHRLNDREPRDLALEAGNDEADVHNMLALASVLAARMNGGDRLSDAVHGAARLGDKVRQIGGGLNPAGYPDAVHRLHVQPGARRDEQQLQRAHEGLQGQLARQRAASATFAAAWMSSATSSRATRR